MTPRPCSRQFDMSFRQLCFIVLFSSELIKNTNTSIAGVSYRDDFDFEERYRKLKPQEGPPVFWYLGNVPIMPQPQIMPEPPILLQSQVMAEMPQMMQQIMPQMMTPMIPQSEEMMPQLMSQPQIMPEIIPQIMPQMMSQIMPQAMPHMMPHVMPHVMPHMMPHMMPHVMPQTMQIAPGMHKIPTTQNMQSPFEALYESFKRDISQKPVAPALRMTKELGKVHVYHQPVSYETMKMIQKFSNAYLPAMA